MKTSLCILVIWLLSGVLADDDRVVALEKYVEALAERHFRLEGAVYNLQKDLTKEKLKNERILGELDTLKETLDNTQHVAGRGKRQITAGWVGFSAVIQKTDLSNLQPGQTIIFDSVITNLQAAYDGSTGMFTAPVKGMYVFNMDVMVEPGHNEYLEFVKDGSHIMYNYAHAGGSLHDASSSRTVVVELDGGSQVWVRVSNNSRHGSGTVHGNGFTTLSGWLLQILE